MRLLPKEHHIYCDESQTGARFMVYGEVVMPAKDTNWFDEVMTEWRIKNNMHAELKWTKVSRGRYTQYHSLVDLFFKAH